MKKNTPLYFITMLLPLLLVFSSCSENPTTAPDPISAIEISALHKTCTEVWINVKAESGSLPRGVKMFVDSVKYEFILTKSDTVLLYEGLKPGKEYGFEMVSNTTKSNKLSVRTLDTTSHAMQWEIHRFGESNYNNTVNDVAIINENDMWFVGEFYRGDTLYDAIHYNGSTFEYMRTYYEENGQKSYGPTYAIKVLDDGEVWLASYHITKYKNGVQTSWKMPANGLNQIIRKFLGTKYDFYVIGDNGAIAHYENGKWTKIATNTGLPIQDIHGAYNAKGEYEIYAVAGKSGQPIERKILKIVNNTAKEIYDGGTEAVLDGIWFTPGGDYYVVGNGILKKNITLEDNKDWKRLNESIPTRYYSHSISGTDINNVFVGGSFGELLHFNGKTWESYKDNPGFYENEFKGLVTQGNIVVGYGYDIYQQGFVAIGRR